MSAQYSPQQPHIRALAEQVAVAASTPLARFVPSASRDPDRRIDEWVEREQRRGRARVKLGLVVLTALIVLAAVALALSL